MIAYETELSVGPVLTNIGRVIEDPRGGVIFIGGSTSSGNTGTLYRLRHAGLNANWETLISQTQLMLVGSAVIPIPDDIANC